MLDKQTKFAKKAFYATIGAPVVMSRLAKSYGEKAMDLGNKIGDDAVARFDESVKEGRKVTKKLGDQKVVEEIQSKMDLEKVQTQVEKLRDQLEGVLSNWRDSFAPAEKPAVTKPVTTKPAATTTATAKAPAKKAPAKTAAKKAPAKTTAKKAPAKTTAKKAPAKKAPARKPATASKATTK